MYNTQNTVRLTKAELDFVDEVYEDIAGTPERIPIKNFFIKAVTLASSVIKPKEVLKEVSKTEDIAEIEALKQQVETLKEENAQLVALKALAEEKATENQEEDNRNIKLQLSNKWLRYIWGVLQVSKKMKFANSYEELIMKIFRTLNARKELVLTEDDYKYLDTLECPYPLEEEEKEEKND